MSGYRHSSLIYYLTTNYYYLNYSFCIPYSNYQGYFSVLPITSSPDESLFWSGTHELVGLVSCMCYSSGMPLVSSLTAPSSAIINDMGNINWCGNTGQYTE